MTDEERNDKMEKLLEEIRQNPNHNLNKLCVIL